MGIMGLAAQAEALAEEAAAANVFMLPDKIANILLKRPPMRSADLEQLIRASVEREGYDDFATLADDFDRLEQVRNDLAHAELAWADSPREDPDHHRWRLVSHRGRALQVLPEIVTVDDLRPEVDRAMDVRATMTGLAYRLGRMRIVHAGGKGPWDLPEKGPGPRPEPGCTSRTLNRPRLLGVRPSSLASRTCVVIMRSQRLKVGLTAGVPLQSRTRAGARTSASPSRVIASVSST